MERHGLGANVGTMTMNSRRQWQPSLQISTVCEEETHSQSSAESPEQQDFKNNNAYDDDDDSLPSSSSSVPDENINFDVVYTLHTFVARTAGQASVVKGDELTLLDDSNPYWWLVRVAKTTEVGYIPAENIEMPTERLARLNKHRNTEITAIHLPVSKSPSNRPKKSVSIATQVSCQTHIILVGGGEEQDEYDTWEETMEDEEDSDADSVVETIRGSVDSDEELAENASLSRLAQFLNHPELTKSDVLRAGPEQTKTLPKGAATANAMAKPPNAMRHKYHAPSHCATSWQKTTSDDQVLHMRKTEASVALTLRALAGDRSGEAELTVLRVFAGNISASATFNTVLVDEQTNADELVWQALDRFHIPLTGDQSAIEYYLSVKTMDGNEITLSPHDKPLAIFQSLTSHLTAPMPSLTHVKQLAELSSTVHVTRVGVSQRESTSSKFGEDSFIRFYLHKRIRRERNGQRFIKISHYVPVISKKPSPSIARHFTRRRSATLPLHQQQTVKMDRMDKLIAVPASITIKNLTSLALDKFHIMPKVDSTTTFHMTLSVNGKDDTVLDPSDILVQVLARVDKQKHADLFFVLHQSDHLGTGPTKTMAHHDKPLPSIPASGKTPALPTKPHHDINTSSATQTLPGQRHSQQRPRSATFNFDTRSVGFLKRLDAAFMQRDRPSQKETDTQDQHKSSPHHGDSSKRRSMTMPLFPNHEKKIYPSSVSGTKQAIYPKSATTPTQNQDIDPKLRDALSRLDDLDKDQGAAKARVPL